MAGLTYTGTAKTQSNATLAAPSAMTICVWFKGPITASGAARFMDIGEIVALFGTGSNNSLGFSRIFSGTAGTWTISAASHGLDLNIWNFFAITYSSSSAANNPTAYVAADGDSALRSVTVVRAIGPTGTATAVTDNLVWGNAESGSWPFGGSLAWGTIYNSILTSAQILQVGREGFITTSLLRGYELTATTGTEQDLSVNNGDATASGSPTSISGPGLLTLSSVTVVAPMATATGAQSLSPVQRISLVPPASNAVVDVPSTSDNPVYPSTARYPSTTIYPSSGASTSGVTVLLTLLPSPATATAVGHSSVFTVLVVPAASASASAAFIASINLELDSSTASSIATGIIPTVTAVTGMIINPPVATASSLALVSVLGFDWTVEPPTAGAVASRLTPLGGSGIFTDPAVSTATALSVIPVVDAPSPTAGADAEAKIPGTIFSGLSILPDVATANAVAKVVTPFLASLIDLHAQELPSVMRMKPTYATLTPDRPGTGY